MGAQFEFTKSGLVVDFTNKSTNNPDSFLWDFGDGNTSNLENPQHTYASTGFYTVTLTTTLGEVTEDVSHTVGVNEDETLLITDDPLIDLVKQYLPTEISDSNETFGFEINSAIKKWQLFLQPLVNREISNEQVYNQSAFIALENYLIASLVARELIINASNQYLSTLNQHAVDKGSEQGAGQEVKSIQTGPSRAEWFSSSELWQNILKEGGQLHLLTNSICSLARRLSIYLHFCGAPAKPTIVPRVYRDPDPVITNPFDKTRY